MIRLNIICEGRTEEEFVKTLLYPHLLKLGILATARNMGTGTSWAKLRRHVLQWLKHEPTSWVTTMVDLYAMPDAFPGKSTTRQLGPMEKIAALEDAFKQDIESENLDNWRFIPYYQLHEFEALLFSSPKDMHATFSMDYKLKKDVFQEIRDQFESPEHINNTPQLAPSWRIKKLVGDYQKPLFGCFVAEKIGLERIRAECMHFNQWLEQLEALKS